MLNALVYSEDVRSGDLNDGYSGECMGRMAAPIEFIYNGIPHRNDLNRCVFTPLKGIIRFQENISDLQASAEMLRRVLRQLAASDEKGVDLPS